MKITKKLKNNNILTFAFLLSIVLQGSLGIYQDKQFKILTTNTYNLEGGGASINICFKNIGNNFRYIALRDKLQDISQLISNQIVIYEYGSTMNSFTLTGEFIDTTKTFFFYSYNYANFNYNTLYCIMLKTIVTESYNLKNLQLRTTSSSQPNFILFDSQDYFGSYDPYLLTSNPALSVLSDFSLNPLANSIFPDSTVTVNLKCQVALPEGKTIPTDSGEAMIVLTLQGENIKMDGVIASSTMDSTSVNDTKLFNLTYYITGNQLVLSSLGEDLINGRKFPLTIQGIKFTGVSTVVLIVQVLWKNTNSVISNQTLSLFTTNLKPVTSATLANINAINTLYTNSNWPMTLSITLPMVLTNSSIVLVNSNNKAIAIASTCDFSQLPSLVTAYCTVSQTATNTTLTMLNVSAKAATQITVNFWISVFASGAPAFNVYVDGQTNITPVTLGNLVFFEAYPNTSASFAGFNQCLNSTQSNCVNRLIASENTGNFVLTSNTNLGTPDLTSTPTVMKLDDLKPSTANNYFKIRYRYDFSSISNASDYSAYSAAWAGEWTTFTTSKETTAENGSTSTSYTLFTNSNLVLGKHTFYFPRQFIVPSNTVECRLTWASSVQLRSQSNAYPDYSRKVTFISDDNLFNNYKTYFASSANISGNTMTLDNYDITGALSTTLFTNFVYAIVSTEPDNTKNTYGSGSGNNNPDPLIATLADFEISSSCARYLPAFSEQSYFVAYDLLHTFAVKGTQTIIRANRFVSLLPQPGIFELATTSLASGNSSKLVANTYLINSTGNDFPCLVQFDFTTTNNFYNSKTNNRFMAFLLGIELINFENVFNYPTNIDIGTVGISSKHLYQGKILKSAFATILPTTVGGFNFGASKLFTNSHYRNYLTTVVSFTNINTSKLPNDLIMLPVKCTKFDYSLTGNGIINSYSFGLTELNFAQGNYSPIYFYDYSALNSAVTFDFQIKPLNSFSSNSNLFSSTAQFDSIVNSSGQKLVVQTGTFQAGSINDKSTFIVLNLNKPVNLANFNLYSEQGVLIDHSFYRIFMATRNYSLNNTSFSNMLVISVLNASTFFNGIVVFNIAGIQIDAIPRSNDPPKNNDFGVMIGGNENNFISNFDPVSSNFMVSYPSKTTLANSTAITITVGYVDNSVLKDGDGKNTACVQVQITLDNNTNIFDIYSSNFIAQTIAGVSNDPNAVTCVYNQAGYFQCRNFSKQTSIYFCNFDLSSNSFQIQKISTYYLSSLVPYIDYTYNPSIATSFAIPSLEYNGAVISSYTYNNSQISYGELKLVISSDFAPFRNMKMSIQGDITVLSIDASIKPTCHSYFDDTKQSDYDVNFFTSCLVDFTNKAIVLTTINQIFLYTQIPKSFYIKLFPVMIADLSGSQYSIDAVFNIDSPGELFPSAAFSPPSVSLTNTAVTISQNLALVNILPYIPGETAVLFFQAALNNNSSIQAFFDKNQNLNKMLNQCVIYLPPSFFGTMPDQNHLQCFLGSVQLEDCLNVDNKMIIINNFFPYTQLLNISIYGFTVPDFNIVDSTASQFLMQFNYSVAGHPTEVILHGVGKMSNDLDKTMYSIGVNIPIHNLVIYNQALSHPFPNNLTDLTLNVSIDNSQGLNSGLSFTDLQNSYIWVYLPEELHTTYQTQFFMSELVPLASNPENTSDYGINQNDCTLYSSLVFCNISASHKLTQAFRYWIITLSNLTLGSAETISGVIDINIYNKSAYLLKTIQMLYSSSNDTTLPSAFHLFTNYRGITISYNDTKYYFQTNTSLSTKPGVYKQMQVKVKSRKGFVANASTNVFLNSDYSNNYETDQESYLLDGRFNSTVSIYLGISCDTLNGIHFVYFVSDNNQAFFAFPIISITTDNTTKEALRFYTFGMVPYNSTSVSISVPKGGFVYLWMKPNQPNFDQFNIGFQPNTKSGTTVSFPNSVFTIPKYTVSALVTSFQLLASSITTKLVYDINVYNNCFQAEVSTINFQPAGNVEQLIPQDFKLSSIISYVNAANSSPSSSTTNAAANPGTSTAGAGSSNNNSTTSNTPGSSKTSYPLNSLVFTFTPVKSNDFPAASSLYCTLFCSNLPKPSKVLLNSLPQPNNTWSQNYFYSQLSPGSAVTLVFNNLMRQVDYTLTCAVQTGQASILERKNDTETFTVIKNQVLTPSPLNKLSCVAFTLTKYDQNFELASLSVIQDAFYALGYLENGCVTAISQNRFFVDGYNPLRITCKSLIDNSTDDQGTNSTSLSNSTNNNGSIIDNADAMSNSSVSSSSTKNSTYSNGLNSTSNLRNRNLRLNYYSIGDYRSKRTEEASPLLESSFKNKEYSKSSSNHTMKSTLLEQKLLDSISKTEYSKSLKFNVFGDDEGFHYLPRLLESASSSNKNTTVTLDICLTPAQNCPTNIDIKSYNTALNTLFLASSSNSNKGGSSSGNSPSSSSSTSSSSSSNSALSPFLSSLSSDMQALYIGFTIIAPDDSINFPKLNITNLSDFKTSTTSALININISMLSVFNRALLCFWNLNSLPLSATNQTYIDVVNCKYSKNILCGNPKGITIPAKIVMQVDINLFSKSNVYSFWISCKENLLIADRFSSPQGALFIPNFPVVIKNITETKKNTTIVACILGNPSFPGCCPQGMIDVFNNTQCSAPAAFIMLAIFKLLIILFIYFN